MDPPGLDAAVTLRVLDLFSGIGMFSLGLERTGGFTTVAFCETDRYCRRVLAKRWPQVPCYDDVRELTADRLARDGITADVICGGWPCQDLSVAGKGAGLAGARSGLWREYARLIRELRPDFALLENVAALLGRGFADVLGDLAEIGYDAEWHCISAASVGAPHRRDRVWVVAYPGGDALREFQQRPAGRWIFFPPSWQAVPRNDGASEPLADTNIGRREGEWLAEHPDIERASGDLADGCGARGSGPRTTLADADGSRPLDGGETNTRRELGAGRDAAAAGGEVLADAECERLEGVEQVGPAATSVDRSRHGRDTARWWWLAEPGLGRVVDGCAHRVDRLRTLGNALVPQIAELIGEAILTQQKKGRPEGRPELTT